MTPAGLGLARAPLWTNRWLPPMANRELEGPQGGRTTRTKSGMVRKTLWLHEDEAEALRDTAYRERRTESAIMREAEPRLLGIED